MAEIHHVKYEPLATGLSPELAALINEFAEDIDGSLNFILKTGTDLWGALEKHYDRHPSDGAHINTLMTAVRKSGDGMVELFLND